ncbi:MAG: STAS domain-containing protein [Solirubrobacteraceae bacterium]
MSEGAVGFDTRGSVLVARMTGEIDLSNAELLGGEIADAVPPDTQRVVLDLTAVEHIDSYGIFVIHGLRQRLREHETSLILVIPRDGRIRRALELVGVQDFIPVKEALEDALHAPG